MLEQRPSRKGLIVLAYTKGGGGRSGTDKEEPSCVVPRKLPQVRTLPKLQKSIYSIINQFQKAASAKRDAQALIFTDTHELSSL